MLSQKSFNAAVLPIMRNFAAKLINRRDIVLVGLSGGADSVCLLHFLQYLAKEKHFALAAVHVNHGLRGKAALADQQFCENLCAQLGVELFVKKVDARKVAQKYDLSPEHGARKARYAAYQQVAKKWGATKLALGHHLDDQAETFLLNLLRGTKAQGLAGIPLRRPLCAGVEIVRPLLCVTRAQVEKYIAQNKLSYVTDQTNFDDVYRRNWVRQTLLPLLEQKQPKIREHLAQFAAEIAALTQK
ncbi:MAG: tRNA lysidine(34) synthetase TilS [Elusimicrobiaceae bacterium]|nr:tRNA lysidine(34) synthetase TilS [Elusimicrobiaceae bacterium]MBP5617402.1 tRNA lysidine(34) synthetase TilS [Elusimicrobiaceae bacterium]